MRHPVFTKHHIFTCQCCCNSDMPPKLLYHEMHIVDWWWEKQVRNNTRAWWRANRRVVNSQSKRNTSTLDRHIGWNASHEFCCRQDQVPWIYNNWQSIFEGPSNALYTDCRNGPSTVDSDQEPKYTSATGGSAGGYKPRGAEQGTSAGSPRSHHYTKSQRQEGVLQCSLCRWQLQALQTGFSRMPCMVHCV